MQNPTPVGLLPNDPGPWIQSINGRRIFLFDPQPGDFDPEVLAVVLSRLARFNGHTREFYSVAQHSVIVADLLAHRSSWWQLAGLLHDAGEIILGDITTPVKSLAPTVKAIESLAQTAITVRYDLPTGILSHAIIKRADMIALSTEHRDLMGPCDFSWCDLPEPDPRAIIALPRVDAERLFLRRLGELREEVAVDRWRDTRGFVA